MQVGEGTRARGGKMAGLGAGALLLCCCIAALVCVWGELQLKG